MCEECNNSTITQEKVDEWITALRSGEYNQGASSLMLGSEDNRSYCCLGVYGVLNGGIAMDNGPLAINGEYQYSFLPKSFMVREAQSFFATLNDQFRLSFEQIAKVAESLDLGDYRYSGRWPSGRAEGFFAALRVFGPNNNPDSV